MKKTLVTLALIASGFAFADAPVSAQPKKQEAPASQPAKAAPAKTEVKFVADKKEEEPAQTTVVTPAVAPKAKLIMVADQKACATCPKAEKDAVAVESKDKTPAQTAAKTPAAPKIALA